MSLEHELLELNGAYQNTVATNLNLRKRCAELEMLLKDAQGLMGTYHGMTKIMYGTSHVLVDIEAWQQRAKELLS